MCVNVIACVCMYINVCYYFLPSTRVVYEGIKCEYVADGFIVEEDVLYYFRVAAVNDVGIGPYSLSVSYTQRKACKTISYLHTYVY